MEIIVFGMKEFIKSEETFFEILGNGGETLQRSEPSYPQNHDYVCDFSCTRRRWERRWRPIDFEWKKTLPAQCPSQRMKKFRIFVQFHLPLEMEFAFFLLCSDVVNYNNKINLLINKLMIKFLLKVIAN
jgi:hypothetical protein